MRAAGKKMNMILIVTLIISLIMPYQAFAEKKLEPVKTLNFSEVEPLMMARYQLILDNVKAYSDANRGQGDVQSGTDKMDSLLVLLSGVSSAGDIGTLKAVLAGMVQAQMQTAIGMNSMAQSTNMSAVGLKTEQGNKTIVWNMELLYITYNNLGQKMEDLKAKKAILEKQLIAAKLQKELGMLTESGVQSVESSLKELESGLKQLEESRLSIKQMFNVNLGQSYNTDIQIGDVPRVTPEQIASIKADDEYKEALKNAYGVRIEDIKSDIDKKNDEIRKFENGFYRAYETILEKQKALEAEQIKMSVAETDRKTADLKFKLGMLSSIQYVNANSAYTTRKAALVEAENALFQAYQQYQWAKKGLIVSAGTNN